MTPGCSMARSPRPVSRHLVHRLVGGTEWRGLPTLRALAYRALRAELRALSTEAAQLTMWDIGRNGLRLVRPLPALPRPPRFVSLQMRIGDAQHRIAAGPVAAALY